MTDTAAPCPAARRGTLPGPAVNAPPEQAPKRRGFPGPASAATPADPAPPEPSACGTPVTTPAHSLRAIRVRRSPR